jgi:uncharacterized protein DUF6159
MFDRIRRSWQLVKEAWGVLRQDTGLVVFPILSGICSLLVMASFVVPILVMAPWSYRSVPGQGQSFEWEMGPWGYLLLFLYYLVSYFVVIFFNSALVACVRLRFSGRRPTVSDGLSFAAGNAGRIFQWALLSATVGVILRTLEERASWLGQIVIGLIGLAWSLATAFVVPVLVYEQVGPIEAVKRSAQAFKRTWGETVVANFGMNSVFGLLFLGGFIILVPGIALATTMSGSLMAAAITLGITVILCLCYWIGLAIVQTALQGIFLTACYQYATTGQVPSAFTPEYVVGAWRPK